jgi:hypothetical protein
MENLKEIDLDIYVTPSTTSTPPPSSSNIDEEIEEENDYNEI